MALAPVAPAFGQHPGLGKIVYGSSADSRSGEVSRLRFRLQVKASNVSAPVPVLANGKMFRLQWLQLLPWLSIPGLNLAKSVSNDYQWGGGGQLGVCHIGTRWSMTVMPGLRGFRECWRQAVARVNKN